MLDLDPIKARLQAATPGPWMRDKWKADIDIVRQVDWTPCGAEGHNDCAVAQTIHPADVAAVGLGHDRAITDAEFIAHTPTDIAALVSEVERLRMALDTIGSTIYTQGRGTKTEQGLLSFIRKSLGRE